MTKAIIQIHIGYKIPHNYKNETNKKDIIYIWNKLRIYFFYSSSVEYLFLRHCTLIYIKTQNMFHISFIIMYLVSRKVKTFAAIGKITHTKKEITGSNCCLK